jgi:hypothetical protein
MSGVSSTMKAQFEEQWPAPDELAEEFAAWDAASDETLINFESEFLF